MRHRVKDNHLGRTDSHRRAMLANMANSLLLHKRIQTTLAKAKALRPYVEPLITKSKDDTTHNRRTVFSYLQNKFAVKELFSEVRSKILERPGGYTRILKLGPRRGDGTEMALIELVDFNEYVDTMQQKGRRRRRRGTKAPITAAPKAAPKAAAPAPAPEPIVEQPAVDSAEASSSEEGQA